MTRRPPLRLRADLIGLAPYVSPQRPARYRMNTNESPYSPPAALVEEMAEALRAIELNRYPDKDARTLLEALAEHSGHPADGLWVANGSNEVFMHLFLAFGGPGRMALTFEPTYPLHSMIPRICGTTVLSYPRADDFDVDFATALEAVRTEQPEVVILCSPNNPTGNLEARTTVEALLDVAPGLVVVDEAYGEFAPPDSSVVPLLNESDKLVVVKTLSKAWRLAGARIGYALASPGTIDQLQVVRLPYHLSALTQALGRAALRYADETAHFAKLIAEEADRIAVQLQRLGVRSFPSHANFVLFEVDDPNAVWKALLSHDVLVRNYAGVPGIERCLRVTAGLPEETGVFLTAMEKVLDA